MLLTVLAFFHTDWLKGTRSLVTPLSFRVTAGSIGTLYTLQRVDGELLLEIWWEGIALKEKGFIRISRPI